MLRVHLVTEHWGSYVGSSSYIRFLLPLAHPAQAGRFVTTHSDDYRPGDILIVERAWTDNMDKARDLIRRARADDACLIYATDDNILDLKIEGPVARWLSPRHQEVIRHLAREADGVIVSTEPLREQMAQFNDRVLVVNNALDERLTGEGLRRSAGSGSRGDRRVIGYMGTTTHDADLAMIAPALTRVLRRHAGRAEFQIVGAVANRAALGALDGLPVRVLRGDHHFEYPAFMRWMARHVQWDVGIAPLRNDEFTRCKSDIKHLDYAAWGVAGIFSRVPAYETSVRHLETGYLATNDVDAWEEGLERLVSDPDLRAAVARGAEKYLLSCRTLRHRAADWRDALLEMRRRRGAAVRGPARPDSTGDTVPESAANTDAGPGRRALVIIPGSVNYFYDRAGERIAAALRGIGWSAVVRTLAADAAEGGRFDQCFLVNLSELVVSSGDKSLALTTIRRVVSRCGGTAAVAIECAGTPWFTASLHLCGEADVSVLLDLGLHDQYEELPTDARPLYRFCFNGLTVAERAAVPADVRAEDRPIPWVLVGHLSADRAALAERLVRESAPDGFVYLPFLSPVGQAGPHLNERQFRSVLSKARFQVWCSHHGHFYMEGERFRDSLLSGSLPLKVLHAPPDARRVLPFENLMPLEREAAAAIGALDFPASWRRFADEFLAMPSLEAGLQAFLEDEHGAPAAPVRSRPDGVSDHSAGRAQYRPEEVSLVG